MNPPYLTTCRYCTGWDQTHLRALHRPNTLRKKNWECYFTGLQGALQGISMEIRDADTLERVADLFSSAITNVYEKNCLLSEIKKARETHWWNRKLGILCKETRGYTIQKQSERPSAGSPSVQTWKRVQRWRG